MGEKIRKMRESKTMRADISSIRRGSDDTTINVLRNINQS
jgi:hypothetical protein